MATLDRRRTTSNITVWCAYIEGLDSWMQWKDVLFVKTKCSGRLAYLTDHQGIVIDGLKPLQNKSKLTLLSNCAVHHKRQTLAHVACEGQQGYLPISLIGYPPRNRLLREEQSLQMLDELIKSAMNDKYHCSSNNNNSEVLMPKLDQRKKTTNNKTVWTTYIEGQRSWKKWKDILFVSIKPGETVHLTDQRGNIVSTAIPLKNTYKLTLLSNKSVMFGNQKLINVSHKNIKGYIPISKVGYTAKNKTISENQSLKSLNTYIKAIDEIGKGITIVVKDGTNLKYTFNNCTGAKNNPGLPKSDYFIYDDMRRPICEISHKKAGGAEKFQQYASITGKPNDIVNQHPFVKEALAKFAKHVDEIIKGARYYIDIPINHETQDLINGAIFGVDYKYNYGKDHVHLVGQGDPILNHIDGMVYELSYSSKTAVSGDINFVRKDGYQPIILARPGSDRSFQAGNTVHRGVRILIGPQKLRGAAKKLS